MKKSLLALAVLGAFAGAASAQSSVTLFGVVDAAARNVKNGGAGSIQSLATDGLASSRLGFRGVEDLGGGLRAGFWLEAGIAPDTGSTNMNPNGTSKLFNRRSTVSLLGGFGEVRLGRDYTPSFWNLTIFDPFGTNGVGAFTNVLSTLGSGAGTLVRADNTIGYFLPSGIGGFYGQAQVAAGEGNTGTNGQNKYFGGRIGYAAGPIDAAFGYGRTDIGADEFTMWNLGAAFNAGFAKLMGQYVRSEYGAREQRVWLVGANVPFGQFELRAAYSDAQTENFGGTASGNQIAVGGVYNLSKRTAIYGTFSRIGNDTSSVMAIPGGPTTGFAAGQNSTGYEVGLRHSF